MPGRAQASSGLPGFPTARSCAHSGHRDCGSSPAGLCQAQQGAWPGRHRARRYFALPPGCPVSSRSGQRAGAGGMRQQHFLLRLPPRPDQRAGSEHAPFPARWRLGTRWGSSGCACTDTDGLRPTGTHPLLRAVLLGSGSSSPVSHARMVAGSHLHPPTFLSSPHHPASLTGV